MHAASDVPKCCPRNQFFVVLNFGVKATWLSRICGIDLQYDYPVTLVNFLRKKTEGLQTISKTFEFNSSVKCQSLNLILLLHGQVPNSEFNQTRVYY